MMATLGRNMYFISSYIKYFLDIVVLLTDTHTYCLPVCLCLRTSFRMEQLCATGGIFMKFIFDHFSKNRREIQISLKSDKNDGYFT